MSEKPKVNRSLEPRVEAPREADELRRVTEIARDIEELGRAMESRDHPIRIGAAKIAKGLAAQAGHVGGQELEQELAARADDEKLLAQERTRCQELERQLAAHADDEKLLAQERTRRQELERQLAARADDEKLLAQERTRCQELERQLAARADDEKVLAQERTRRQKLERQLAARADDEKLLAQERARCQELERQLAAHPDDEKLLAQERARCQELEQHLVERRNATLDRGRSLTATMPNRPASMPMAPDAPGSLEAARLMEEARLLLDQGNVGTARGVLQRAAESGSATALFLLAETYDREMLSVWGIFGRHGNSRKARELYTKAVAGGIHEAKYRLSTLR